VNIFLLSGEIVTRDPEIIGVSFKTGRLSVMIRVMPGTPRPDTSGYPVFPASLDSTAKPDNGPLDGMDTLPLVR